MYFSSGEKDRWTGTGRQILPQKKKNHIGANEFLFWLIFWLLAAGLIIFLKSIDKLVSELGFSGSGIEVLLYLSVAILFYFVFRLRLKFEKIEKSLIHRIEHLKKQNISMAFYPVEIKVNQKTLQARVTGDVVSTIGQTALPAKRTTYTLTYRYQNGNLWISHFEEMKPDEKK